MHQLCLKLVIGLILWWCSYDVFYLGSLLLVELVDDVVEIRSLARDGCQLELRFRLREPDGRSVGPEGWHSYCDSVHLCTGGLFSCAHHTEKLSKYDE